MTNQLTLFDTSVYDRAPHWPEWKIYESEEAKIDSATLPLVVAESTSPPHLVDSATELEAVTESTPPKGQDSVTRSVAPYWPRGTARGGPYFRFSYKDGGGRTRHRHIPGGTICNSIAVSRALEVSVAVAAGKSVAEILALIRSWPKCDRRRLPPF